MALVQKLELLELEHDRPHAEVNCTYWIVPHENGELSLQIDTYGSRQRRMLGKKSQSIRFSPAAITQLRQILKKLEQG